MWGVLGIAPTADTAAVRRAYVAKLRAIDVEREPAAFIRLREAYEGALAAGAYAQFDDETETTDDLSEIEAETALAEETIDVAPIREATLPKPQPLLPPPAPPIEIEIEEDPEWAIDEALEKSGVVAAWQTFEHAMATGAISLGEEAPLMNRLVAAALDYRGPGSAAFFRSIIATLGATKPSRDDDLVDFRTTITERLAAEKWLDEIENNAGTRAFGKRKFVVLASRILLGRKRRYRRSRALLSAIERLLGDYRLHHFWLDPRLGAERMAALEKRLQRDLVIKKWQDNILVIGVLTFLAVDFLWVLIHGD
jgi:hypothetical protein